MPLRLACCSAAAMLCLGATAAAQTVDETIRASVKTGQRVTVTADTGEQVKGRVINVATDALTLRDKRDDITIPYAQIIRIEKQRDSLYNGLLIGFGVGAAYGAKAFSDATPPAPCGSFLCSPDPSLPGYVMVWGGLATVVGAAVDALIFRRERTLFGRVVPARVSVSPAVQRGVHGVIVRLSW